MLEPIAYIKHSPEFRSPTTVAGNPPRGAEPSFSEVLVSTAREVRVEASQGTAVSESSGIDSWLEGLSRGESEMSEMIDRGMSRRSFRPAELLSMQAQVYQYSQQLSIATKMTDALTSGIKQVTNIQV